MKQAILLYRSLLKNARKIEQYNFRSFAIRKVKEDFQISKGLLGHDAGNFLFTIIFIIIVSILLLLSLFYQ